MDLLTNLQRIGYLAKRFHLCINSVNNDGYNNDLQCNGKIVLEPKNAFKLWVSMDGLIFRQILVLK